MVPTFLQSRYQLYYIQFLGFYYTERSSIVDWVCIQVAAASMMGLLTFAVTESTLVIVSFYLCGLFEIARYVRKTVTTPSFKPVCIHLYFNTSRLSPDCTIPIIRNDVVPAFRITRGR